MERAAAAVSDSSTGFVFLHVPVPHAPHAYDRATGLFDKKNAPVSGYIDSLSLTDRALFELRQEMEARGLWKDTTLIISADHPYREARGLDGKFDNRVPFLVKLATQNTVAVVQNQLHTIVTAQFVLAILDGTISSTPDAVEWLERHGQETSAAVQSRGALAGQ
jgi:arylsulfatase A-like enzyme